MSTAQRSGLSTVTRMPLMIEREQQRMRTDAQPAVSASRMDTRRPITRCRQRGLTTRRLALPHPRSLPLLGFRTFADWHDRS
ncbi:hypothetical protein NSERUTF1_4036 [Nocardia seriolae]|nr:hypothetical protein NSERUTF1_4036 [Nocardia seriolae]